MLNGIKCWIDICMIWNVWLIFLAVIQSWICVPLTDDMYFLIKIIVYYGTHRWHVPFDKICFFIFIFYWTQSICITIYGFENTYTGFVREVREKKSVGRLEDIYWCERYIALKGFKLNSSYVYTSLLVKFPGIEGVTVFFFQNIL